MRIARAFILDEFVEERPEADSVITRWKLMVKAATWRRPDEVRSEVSRVSILRNRRLIFDLGGHKYRIITVVNYEDGVVEVRFAGTHAQYDRVNAMEI